MRLEHACQRVLGAQRKGQVLAHGDEMRELDRRLHSDQEAIRPVLAQHPGIDFVEAWKAPPMHHFRPMTQHSPDQPPLVLHPLGFPAIARQRHNLTAERLSLC